jgi:PAS domain S-box-containing protein
MKKVRNDMNTKPSILIVEDNNIVMLELKDRLSEMDYEVVGTASSGLEAINKAGIHRPDLTLMDIRLKGEMDGIEAAAKIKEEFNLPVVYLTAHTDESTISRAKITEPFGYIIKPFEERELHSTIEMALYKHKMEKKLKESEHWLSATLKSIGDALIATDSKGIIKIINPVAEGITGWKYKDAFGLDINTIFRVVDKEGNSLENPVITSLQNNRIVGETDKVLIAKDGSETPVDFSSAPIKDGNDSVGGVVLVFRNISERKKTKELLEKQRLFLREIIDTDPNFITVKNSEGKFELTNKAVANALGTTTEKIVGKSDSEYFTNEEIAYQRNLELEALNSLKEVYVPEEKLIDLKGKVHLLQTFRRAINSLNGDEKLVLSVASDITELKLTEKALRESKERLKQKAAELAELNLKLSESENMLISLNASKDKFFSIIAHDLRSPFTGLLGLTEYLAERIDDLEKEELHEVTQNILKSAKTTFNLLENLLQWAKIKTGRINSEPKEVNLKKTVDKMIELFKSNAAKKNISFTTNINSSINVFADLNMVETIFRNLISNSIKFTGNGGNIKISVTNGKSFTQIDVVDTGMGISSDNINKLFRIDQNISTKGTEDEEGSGLGLILCKEFIEINQGKLSVESKLGEGTTFSFTLPTMYN